MLSGGRAVVRGGGELASATARLLFLCGVRVVVLEREKPLAVRRLVPFADAVVSGKRTVEAVTGRLVGAAAVPGGTTSYVPVVIDPEGRLLTRWSPEIVVDARMAKARSA